MVNAWSLLYDELYGDDEMTENKIEITTGAGNTASTFTTDYKVDLDSFENVSINTSECPKGISVDDYYPSAFNTFADNDDAIAHHVNLNYDTLNINVPDADLFASMDGVELPTPGIESDNPRKYKEDESIKALQDYISTTYGGHYTSDNNSVQTLDLIESVGDAESFCRSNAIKYLSRYDKKGQAKRDILKALHYSLLLYHFSGQLNETPTRGYETF